MAKVIEWCCSSETADEACGWNTWPVRWTIASATTSNYPLSPFPLEQRKPARILNELSQYRDRQPQGQVCYSIRLEFMDCSEWDPIFALDLTNMLTSGGIKSLEFLSTGGISGHLMQAVGHPRR